MFAFLRAVDRIGLGIAILPFVDDGPRVVANRTADIQACYLFLKLLGLILILLLHPGPNGSDDLPCHIIRCFFKLGQMALCTEHEMSDLYVLVLLDP